MKSDVGPKSNTGGCVPCYRCRVRAWGPAPVLFLLLACATTEAPGTYEVVQPAAGGGERHIRVTLNADGAAALSSTFSERPSRFLAEGKWTRDGRRITVEFNDQKQMVFELAGDQLHTKEWNQSEWGEKGPGALFRVYRDR
jgi:NlpE N-terminal domain